MPTPSQQDFPTEGTGAPRDASRTGVDDPKRTDASKKPAPIPDWETEGGSPPDALSSTDSEAPQVTPGAPRRAAGQADERSGGGPDAGADAVHGEGNYAATRDYNARTREFIDAGKVDEAAERAAPANAGEREAMEAAEQVGKGRAKG